MRKGLLVTIAILISAMIAVVIIGTMTVRSEAQSDLENKTKCFENIRVENGDTLWDIAEEYAPLYGCSTKQYIREIMRINGMESDFIVAGDPLLVVYFE